jgi:hypothetical protein
VRRAFETVNTSFALLSSVLLFQLPFSAFVRRLIMLNALTIDAEDYYHVSTFESVVRL